MPQHSKRQHGDSGHVRRPTRGRVARAAITMAGAAVVALAATSPALASTHATRVEASHYRYPVDLVAVTPSPYDTAGTGGVFNVDLAAVARNRTGNNLLSAANGYTPTNLTAALPGIGHPDPNAPGLVVLLSTTPQKAGGPNANLAGVFQLTDVARSRSGLNEVIADWEVGKAGAFGKGSKTTLTAYLVKGTAPGIVTSPETKISNTVKETFTIGS